MERFWRWLGVTLGRQWKAVVAIVVVLTVALALLGRNVEFATGQDSYLNSDSQIAIDNVDFQDDFGGETVVLLFSSNDGSDVSKLFEGSNLAELQRITDELAAVDGVYAALTPLTSLDFTANLVSGGVGSAALLAAASRDESAADVRQTDIQIALARVQAVDDETIGNPAYNQLLIFGDDGFTIADGEPVAPPTEELVVRASLRSTFPNVDGGVVNGTAVGGAVLDGNASLDEQTAATEDVLEVLETAEFDGFDLTVTGSPVYLAEINDYLQGGMLTLGAAALVLMAIVLAVLFRVRWRLLPLLAVVVGVLWSFSLLGIIGIDLSLVTISGLPILIGVGIDFAIQVHNRVEEEVVLDKAAHPVSETIANLAPALFAATFTGVLAFLALRISRVPMIRDFGVLLAIGIVALVIVGIVVPGALLGVRERRRPTQERSASMVERVVVRLGGLPVSFGWLIVLVAAALFAGGVAVEDRAEIQSDPIEWIDQDSQVAMDADRLETETGFATTLGILIAANNVHDQDVIDLVWDFTLAAEERPEVVSTSSAVNTMGKIIAIPGATPIPPTSEDVVASIEVMPPAIKTALYPGIFEDVSAEPTEPTGMQLSLRLAPAGLEDRAELVEELEADLQRRIDALDLPDDSILLVDLPEGQDAVRATPAGLATVGIGLLDNLTANRSHLTYLALCLAALFLVLRFRSLSRALLALVPVVLAVGASTLVIGLIGVSLSPLTTVSGPLVIASCAEFSVLLLARYLEERQRGLLPRDATTTAASRTGQAFFTSAVTTICGFGVLISSSLPLLRDFGLVVTLNVAIALLAALVVMPPLSVWVDEKGWLGTVPPVAGPTDSVRLAAAMPSGQTVGAAIGAVGFVAGSAVVLATADTSTGEASTFGYEATPLPTTTTTTTTTVPDDSVPDDSTLDPADFGTERPTSLVGGIVFDQLTALGVPPNQANCAVESVEGGIDNIDTGAVLAGDQAAAAPVIQAALDCGIEQETIDAALAAILAG